MHSQPADTDSKRARNLFRRYGKDSVRLKGSQHNQALCESDSGFFIYKRCKNDGNCLQYDYGIINPAARKIAQICDENNRIGVIATKVTIASDDYNREIKRINPKLQVFSKAAPAFVPLIEEGIIDNEIMDLTIKYYLDDFVQENEIDTLVLGCTHYPIIRKNISRLYPQLRIVNPSYEIIARIKEILENEDLLAEEKEGENVFYASDLSENFINMIQKILETEKSDLILKFKNLDL